MLESFGVDTSGEWFGDIGSVGRDMNSKNVNLDDFFFVRYDHGNNTVAS
jgi:hypothetical protein